MPIFIKIEGEYINLENTYRITPNELNNTLTFYDVNSILPLTLTFSNLQELKLAVSKLESILRVIDLDLLAPQNP